MKLLIEKTNESDVNTIVEETNGKKNYCIEGIFMSADLKNRNGRVYPKQVMESAVNKYSGMIAENRAMGELNHPDGPSINLDKVSHLITELRFNGNHVYGKAKLLETPMGNTARALMEGGVKLGVSSRGLGTLKESNGAKVVQNDFMITAIDIVGDPSAPDAFVTGLYENKEYIWENGIVKEVEIQKIAEAIETASKEDREKVILEQFEKFIKSLKS